MKVVTFCRGWLRGIMRFYTNCRAKILALESFTPNVDNILDEDTYNEKHDQGRIKKSYIWSIVSYRCKCISTCFQSGISPFY